MDTIVQMTMQLMWKNTKQRRDKRETDRYYPYQNYNKYFIAGKYIDIYTIYIIMDKRRSTVYKYKIMINMCNYLVIVFHYIQIYFSIYI